MWKETISGTRKMRRYHLQPPPPPPTASWQNPLSLSPLGALRNGITCDPFPLRITLHDKIHYPSPPLERYVTVERFLRSELQWRNKKYNIHGKLHGFWVTGPMIFSERHWKWFWEVEFRRILFRFSIIDDLHW